MAPVLALSFIESHRLWLLVGVALLAGSYLITQRRRTTYAVRFTNLALLDSVAPARPGWRRHVPAVFLLAALAGMVGAYAVPARDQQVPREQATIIVAIDVSLSMAATDVSPSRLEAAQVAAKDFIAELPERLNVGLVSFSGIAQVRVRPTQDREQLYAAIDMLRLAERTATGDAILASLQAIESMSTGSDLDATAGDGVPAEEEEPVPARIVLMSDGTRTEGIPEAEAAERAREAGVPVSTIAFGTQHGTIQIEGQPGPTPVAVDPVSLAAIADYTGGTAFTAATGEELARVYDDIGSAVGFTTEQQEITESFVLGSLLVLFAAGVTSQLWFSRLP